MATALQSFRFTVRSCSFRPCAHRYTTKSIGRRRAFSTAPVRRQNHPTNNKELLDALAKADAAPGGDQRRFLETQIPGAMEIQQEFDTAMTAAAGRVAARLPKGRAPRRKKPKQTFLNMGEPEPFEDDEGDEDDDDISTLAHGELEQHRERRHYARLAAWEMPLLAKMAKQFEPPTADMPLRFRYTTYMGEQHPAEKKVVLEFCTADMPDLSIVQREKLKKLLGVRYNPQTDIVRMSCEMYETQAQNKRYLGDLVDTLLLEAKDPTDTFEDVPLDTRHHVFKQKPRFPKEWRLTEERRAELAEYREGTELKDHRRMLTGKIVDGVKEIEDALAKSPAVKQAYSEMVVAGKGSKGKGKRVTVRR